MAQYPIYTTRGEWVALLIDGYLYNPRGEWTGWLDRDGKVFSVRGDYVGWLSRDFRVLRKRETNVLTSRRTPPATPSKVTVPNWVPLAPLMQELLFDTIDVFEEMPGLLGTLDIDQLEDID